MGLHATASGEHARWRGDAAVCLVQELRDDHRRRPRMTGRPRLHSFGPQQHRGSGSGRMRHWLRCSSVNRQSSVTGGRGRNSHNGGEGDSPKCAEDGRDRDAHVHIGLSRAPRGVDNTERGLRTWTQQRGQPLANTALMLRQNETGDGDAPLRSQVLKSSPRSGSCDPSTCRKRLPAEGRLVRQRVAGV